METDRIAQGVQAIVKRTCDAARVHVADRGHRPPIFTLNGDGRGGPLHGCDVARKVGY